MISLTAKSENQSLERVKAQIIDELNIKELKAVNNESELESAGYEVSLEAGYGVAIATEITPELATEGLARDIVHRLQTMRRSAGFDIADHITTYYQGGDYVKQVMDAFGEYIRRETLSREMVEGIPVEGVFSEKFKLAGNEVMLAVTKMD
jgi:isoleucyl-tRNA synthetase